MLYHVPYCIIVLILLILIHETQSFPPSPYFTCPDNVHNGDLKPPFTNNTCRLHHQSVPQCELVCENKHTMINCTDSPDQTFRLLSFDSSNNSIVVEYPDSKVPDPLKYNPCEVYSALVQSFQSEHPPSPIFDLVILKSSETNDTFLGCPYSEDNHEYLDNEQYLTCGVDNDVIYPNLPGDPPLHGCFQFPNFSWNNLKEKTRGTLLKTILCSVLSVSGLAILLIILVVYRRKRNSKSCSTTPPSRIMSVNYITSHLEEGSTNNGVIVFSYAELQEVTNNFDPARELGEGGFGVVYYGKLRDGREVAVKRMFEKNYKQIEQFKNEIKILTKVRHPNLVTLYGCSSRHSRELLLVYEYISNGTVADHLHGDQSKSILLLWNTRMKIAIETATALTYLHFKDIIHRDIKTNNILLDKNFCAKVADFGLSRLFPVDVTHVSTAPQGTPGYLDPEYHQCYHLTDKSDVYSFGVVLIELISSLHAVDMGRDRHEVKLANYAMNKIQCCDFKELVDPKLGFETNFKVRRMTTLVAELAFRCLQHERELRPSMEEVMETLKRIESVDYDELEVEEMGMKTCTTNITKLHPLPIDSDV